MKRGTFFISITHTFPTLISNIHANNSSWDFRMRVQLVVSILEQLMYTSEQKAKSLESFLTRYQCDLRTVMKKYMFFTRNFDIFWAKAEFIEKIHVFNDFSGINSYVTDSLHTKR